MSALSIGAGSHDGESMVMPMTQRDHYSHIVGLVAVALLHVFGNLVVGSRFLFQCLPFFHFQARLPLKENFFQKKKKK